MTPHELRTTTEVLDELVRALRMFDPRCDEIAHAQCLLSYLRSQETCDPLEAVTHE